MREHEHTSSSETTGWLEQRQMPGNWIDVAKTDEIPADVVGAHRTILHMFQIAFAPEIRHRLSAGQLNQDFFLTAAQLVQPEGGGKTVRLNEEIRGTVLVRANRPVCEREQVLFSDLRDFVSFDLLEDELDAAHFTLLWNGGGWIASFDFRAGRAKSADMLEAARQFLDTAKFSATKGHARPSVDNLFSACELVSKAHLILHRSPAIKSRSHGRIRSAINVWRRLGNVNEEFVKLFNEMSKARSPARYDASAQIESPSQTDFHIVEREIEQLAQQVALRTVPAPSLAK